MNASAAPATEGLAVRGLVKIHPGPVCALKGIDLDVPSGMFGLLGPNGAGKSTFMSIVAGLVEPTAGSVWLDGTNIVKQPEFVRERLGFLPQDFGFYPDLTGQAMLEFLLRLKGVSGPKGRKALAGELLERVNLTEAAKRKVGGYSGGMRQRLGLAQAIAGNPRIVIVDEPTAGLDPEERQRFYRLLAVIRFGEVVSDTTPTAARSAVDGLVREGFVDDAALPAFAEDNRVLSAVLVEGRTNRVRIFLPPGAESPPGFVPSPGTLEDAYLVLMRCPPHEIPGPLARAVPESAASVAGGAA
jgi:ABC-type Na+ transport system ATPase subunit NatA